MIEKMIEKINNEIAFTVGEYEKWSDWKREEMQDVHQQRIAKIHGMIDILSIATGKEYVITNNGLKERNE